MANSSRVISAGTRMRLRLVSDDRLVASIRDGDRAAFEALYERHAARLLSFCVYMLGSRADAEDALQATFTSAYRGLVADNRPITVRPWLFTIARNECLSILRRARPTVELNGEVALTGDPVRRLELDEEIRGMLAGMRELPEDQRAALVLAEVHGLTQAEIASVLGVRPQQVKAYIYQARSNLISERDAREADCREIREELASARGAALLRGRLRRHVRSCAGCRAYASGVAHQHRQLGVLLPFAPALALKYREIEQAIGLGAGDPATYAGGAALGASMTGAAVEVMGGGVKAVAVKIAAGVAALGAGAGLSVSALNAPEPPVGSSYFTQGSTAALVAEAGRQGAGHSGRGHGPLAGLPTGGAGQAPAAAGAPLGTFGSTGLPALAGGQGGAPDGGSESPSQLGDVPSGEAQPPGPSETHTPADPSVPGSSQPGGESHANRASIERKRQEHAEQREAREREHEELRHAREALSKEERAERRREHKAEQVFSRSPKAEEERKERIAERKRLREEQERREEEEAAAGG
jgi:RNA polymerase sigma factor (sigma-70 family)